MRIRCRLYPFALAGVMGGVGGTVACGGDSSTAPGKPASSVTDIVGDNQEGPTGGQPEFPLSLVLLGSGGAPLEGGTVNWSVPTGGASASPTKSTSDVAGFAATTVTLGPSLGNVVVRATVTGIAAPVDFHLTAVLPCSFHLPHTIGGTRSGTLTTADCNLGGAGWFYDLYELQPATQVGAKIRMSATAFDTYLELFTVRGDLLFPTAVNNDSGPQTTNASLTVILAPGVYTIGANTNLRGATGSYTLTSASRPQTLTGCSEDVWLTLGVSINDDIMATDCADTTTSGVFYADVAPVIVFSGTVIKVAERSSAIDAFLTLFVATDTGLVVVASNDDSAGTTTDAYVEYTVPLRADSVTNPDPIGRVYVIAASTSAAGTTGAYTLDISPGPAAIAAAVARQPVSFRAAPRMALPAWRPLPRRLGTH